MSVNSSEYYNRDKKQGNESRIYARIMARFLMEIFVLLIAKLRHMVSIEITIVRATMYATCGRECIICKYIWLCIINNSHDHYNDDENVPTISPSLSWNRLVLHIFAIAHV